MTAIVRIDQEDQVQIPIIGKTKLQYNSNDELIFIETDYAGKVFIQKVTDSFYTGGGTAGAITREKVFNEFVRQ